jgi:hypothetical protein
MHPLPLAREWEARAPEARHVIEVPDVNHYTIAWGAHGAAMVADEIARAVSAAGA